MGTALRDIMDREAALKTLFDRIDALESKDQSLSLGELKKVFAEHADEFIKFCDGQGAEGKDDQALTFDEFKTGILNDSKDLSDDEFKANWITPKEEPPNMDEAIAKLVNCFDVLLNENKPAECATC